MSYVVSIARKERPIEVSELRRLVESDPELSILESAVDHDVLDVLWRNSTEAEPVAFVLSAGSIEVTTPSDAALRKMQLLAGQLDAKIIGEEGEDLTNVEVLDVEFSPNAAWGCLLLVAIGVAAWILLGR